MKYFLKSIIWAIFILFISLTPGDKIPEVGIINFDKFVHFAIYYILVTLTLVAFSKTKTELQFKYFLFTALFGIFFGGLIEILQATVAINRCGDWLDFTSNSLGAASAALLFNYFKKLLLRFSFYKFV